MNLITKCNKRFIFVCVCVCDIGIFSQYTWIVSLKDIKGIKITNAFQKFLNESGRKPRKIRIDRGSEFYDRSIKSWSQDNDI